MVTTQLNLVPLNGEDRIRLEREFYDNFESLTGPIATILPDIKEKLDNHFGDNYEIRPHYFQNVIGTEEDTQISLYANTATIYLRFPVITIVNSVGNHHTIKDLFVKFDIIFFTEYPEITYSVNSIKGTRTTLSYSEYISGYSHSHLPTTSLYNDDNRLLMRDFCTGSGPINNVIAMLGGSATSFDINLFEFYLIQIKEFVKWESLEGIPYFRMENIGLVNIDITGSSYDIAFLKSAYEKLKFNFNNVISYYPINWKFTINGLYQIIDDIQFERFLYQALKDTEYGIFLMKNSSGKYCSRRDDINMSFQDMEKTLLFRGQDIPFTVVDDYEVKGEDKIELFLHPKIKKYVKSKLEYQQNYSSIRKAIIQRNS